MKVIYIADAKDAELSLKFINKKRGGVNPPAIITTNICYFLYKFVYNIF